MAQDRLYFRQLLAGRDFAKGDPIARQMVNFVYLIGDRDTGDAVVVDAAYAVQDLLDILAADGMHLAGALATHYHQDHVGGSMMGHSIEGVPELLALSPTKIHVQAEEKEWVQRVTGASDSDFETHASGDTLMVGEIPIELIHTPGHTPGSQCFYVDGKLVAGDTLFLDSCGRLDLPGADAGQMYDSVTQRLAKVPDSAMLYPGHMYSTESTASMEHVRRWNVVFQPEDRDTFVQYFGR